MEEVDTENIMDVGNLQKKLQQYKEQNKYVNEASDRIMQAKQMFRGFQSGWNQV